MKSKWTKSSIPSFKRVSTTVSILRVKERVERGSE